MKAIQFLDLTHADVGGGQSVRKPYSVGNLTDAGMAAFTYQPAHWLDVIMNDLRNFESVHFGRLYRFDQLHSSRETMHVPGYGHRGARSPGWHQDGIAGDRNHMYLIGSADQEMNTQYAINPARNSWFKNLQAPSNPSPESLPQQTLTEDLQSNCGIGQIGAGEVVVMPLQNWHRSSPNHCRRTKDWPFLRIAVNRLNLRR